MGYWEEEMRRIRREVLRAAREFGRALDEIFREMHREFRLPAGFARPFVDVYERGGEVIVEAEMPGVNKEDIEVTATEDAVEIRAEARREAEERGERYFLRERSYRGFYRKVRLPAPVDPKKARATYENGILRVRLPKVGAAAGERIEIE